jgi:hypothetical protein
MATAAREGVVVGGWGALEGRVGAVMPEIVAAAQAAMPGSKVVAGAASAPLRAPLGEGARVFLWVAPPLEVVLGLRPWVDAAEGIAQGEVAWEAVDIERGLREALRQSLGGLDFWGGLRWRRWPPGVHLGAAWEEALWALAPGAVHRGAAQTLLAAARGLAAAGGEEGALRLGRMGLGLVRGAPPCGDPWALARSVGGQWAQVEAALAAEAPGRLGASAPAYAALDRWLRAVRLASLGR